MFFSPVSGLMLRFGGQLSTTSANLDLPNGYPTPDASLRQMDQSNIKRIMLFVLPGMTIKNGISIITNTGYFCGIGAITSRLKCHKKYILEMIADWMGAGRAKSGKWEVNEWYERNKDNIKLSLITRRSVESILDNIKLSGFILLQ